MTISPGALILLAFGVLDIALGLWAYLGPPEEHGAPIGFRNVGKTWHGRGTVCAALPAGVFFTSVALAGTVVDDTVRKLFVYLALLSIIVAIVFLVRAPNSVRPRWLREESNTGKPPV